VLDDKNYRGNINIGTKYTRQDFMDKVYLHPASATSFKFPANRLMTLQGQVPESALIHPLTQDTSSEPCLVVFKNGAKTGTTIGKANNVSPFTRNLFRRQVPGIKGVAGDSHRQDVERVFHQRGLRVLRRLQPRRRHHHHWRFRHYRILRCDLRHPTPKILHATQLFKDAYLA